MRTGIDSKLADLNAETDIGQNWELAGLILAFAMLDEVARRVRVLEEEHRPEPEMRVAREFSYWGDLTSTTSGFQAKPRLSWRGGIRARSFAT